MELLTAREQSSAEDVAQVLHNKGSAPTRVHKTTLIRHAKEETSKQDESIRAVKGQPAEELSDPTIEKRMQYAQSNRGRSWGHVMFTDRKRFLWRHPGAKVNMTVWRKRGSKYTARRASHPKGFNVYAGLTRFGMTKAHPVTGTYKLKHKPGRPYGTKVCSVFKLCIPHLSLQANLRFAS